MIRNKTVYFLGAGASAASEFELPTMKNFFKEFSIKTYPNLSRFIIKHYFPRFYFNLASKDIQQLEKEKVSEIEETIQQDPKLNLEEIFSYLDYYLSKTRFKENLYAAKRELIYYIFKRLNIHSDKIKSLNQNKVWSDIFASIFRKLSYQDTIITLNYDVVIESTLEKVWKDMSKEEKKTLWGEKASLNEHPLLVKLYREVLPMMKMYWSGLVSPFYKIEESRDGLFLKLHGSLNWVYCPNKLCINHFNIFPTNSIELAMQLAIFPRCRVCGEPLEIAIVPPSMYKVYEEVPKINFIWSLAYQELRKASEIIIIGVSFADTDFYLRGLFKSAIIEGINYIEGKPKYPQVKIVDENKQTCEAVREKIKNIGVEAEFIECVGNLDDFVKKYITK